MNRILNKEFDIPQNSRLPHNPTRDLVGDFHVTPLVALKRS